MGHTFTFNANVRVSNISTVMQHLESTIHLDNVIE